MFSTDDVREIVSGAGHDCFATSIRVPTSMIFIPSKNGISHNQEEYSSPEEIDNGFRVLLNTILRYDELRRKNAWSIFMDDYYMQVLSSIVCCRNINFARSG